MKVDPIVSTANLLPYRGSSRKAINTSFGDFYYDEDDFLVAKRGDTFDDTVPPPREPEMVARGNVRGGKRYGSD